MNKSENKEKSHQTQELPAVMDDMFLIETERQKKKLLAYVPSFFTTASLPFRNVNSPVFIRKGSNGITLKLKSSENVPFGRYGRLLLSLFTTHAVLSKEKDCAVMIQYDKLLDLLNELQLPKSRGKDVKEQLDCFTDASFAFEQKVEERKQGYLFENFYEKGEKLPKGDVVVKTVSTGNIRFTTGVQYKEIDDGSKSNKLGAFKIILSPEFSSFCQAHAVPIDYTAYKNIESPAGKDIYAWLVYRNNREDNEPIFIPKEKLVEQFMPVGEDAHPKQESTNYGRIIDHIKEIKEKYYPEVKVSFDPNGSGITLYKSPTPVLKDDTRYALITSDI